MSTVLADILDFIMLAFSRRSRTDCTARPRRSRALQALGGLSGGLAALVLATATPAQAGDNEPAFITGGAGLMDVSENDILGDFRIEYRSNKRFWIFKPVVGMEVVSDGSFYAHAGVASDIFLNDRLVLTPSFNLGYWNDGDTLKLGYELEFRSQLEIAYRFDDRSRIGLALHHISNANLGDSNPGTESIAVYYSYPLNKLFGN